MEKSSRAYRRRMRDMWGRRSRGQRLLLILVALVALAALSYGTWHIVYVLTRENTAV